jgi:NAD(P)-dependent dehydrogenase (short-subunit alcohol dehydrogenase family)
MVFAVEYMCSQMIMTPSYSTNNFSGQTVIVTGSNTGLGLKAARHLVRLNAEKVILLGIRGHRVDRHVDILVELTRR